MNAKELRETYLQFFEERDHKRIPSAPLLPENDPTVLFTTAGMHPLVPFLLGEPHPLGRRLVNFQKCIRTNDIDEVGDPSHLTFFEMLGNWSLGDYFKQESLTWSYEFLTQVLGIDPARLAVTVFAGDAMPRATKNPRDIWRRLGIPASASSTCPRQITGGGRPAPPARAALIRKCSTTPGGPITPAAVRAALRQVAGDLEQCLHGIRQDR